MREHEDHGHAAPAVEREITPAGDDPILAALDKLPLGKPFSAIEAADFAAARAAMAAGAGRRFGLASL